MSNINIRQFQPTDSQQVIDLWFTCGLVRSWNNPQSDIERKMAEHPELFFVAELDGQLIGSCMAGYEGHRGWIYYLAVHPQFQRRGVAAQLMQRAETGLAVIGCPKVELMIRSTNLPVVEFYETIGYVQEPVVVMSKRLIEDVPYERSA